MLQMQQFSTSNAAFAPVATTRRSAKLHTLIHKSF
jgi:hypothetical protein